MESQEGISVGGEDAVPGSHLQSPTQPSETVEQQVGTLIDLFRFAIFMHGKIYDLSNAVRCEKDRISDLTC